jgi:hypothetical protein
MFNVNTVGGSTQKPTSETKKKQAIDVGKIMGQFVQFAPAEVIEVTLRLLNDAFDEIELPQDIFQRISDAAAVALRRGNSDAGPGTGGAPPGGEAPDGGDPAMGEDQLMQIAQLVDSLPPQAKVALGNAMARGVPVTEALPALLEALQQRTMNNG